MWLIFQLIIFVVVVIAILHCVGYVRYYTNPLRAMPGPPFDDAIFGSLGDFSRHKCRLLEQIKQDRKYGRIRKSYMLYGDIRVVLTDSYWIKHVLSTHSKNFSRGMYTSAECIFAAVGDNGLIVVSGEQHKRLRKSASPAFKLSTIKKLMPLIELCGDRMKNLLTKMCDGLKKEIEIRDLLNKVTLDIIGLIAFGYDFKESCTLEQGAFGSDIHEWFAYQNQVIFPFPNAVVFVYAILKICSYLPKLPFNLVRAAQTNTRVHALIEGIAKAKLEQRRKNVGTDSDESNKSLLDFMLESNDNENISRQEVHDLLMTFLIAGHETSAQAITWTLFMLSKHIEYQNKCREEINKFFERKEDKEKVGWDELKDLKFLNAVINESMRMFPPIPWVNRRTNVDMEIESYHIKANTDLLLIIAEMHRDPEYWPNPDEFIPERFLEPDDNIAWHAFMPFGDGVHKCIGYQVAQTEVSYLLVVLLKNFMFTIDPDVEYFEYSLITMRPNPNIKLFVKPVQI